MLKDIYIFFFVHRIVNILKMLGSFEKKDENLFWFCYEMNGICISDYISKAQYQYLELNFNSKMQKFLSMPYTNLKSIRENVEKNKQQQQNKRKQNRENKKNLNWDLTK